MYACVLIGVHYWQLRPGRPLKGLPSVGVYTCMDLRMHLHGCIYMRVWVGLGNLYGLRGSTEVKKGYRIDIVKWMCATRDWVYACTYMGAFTCVCVGGTG